MPEKQLKIESNPPSDKTKVRLDAWVTAISSAGVLFLTAHFLYSFGVFVKPLIDNFGWSRAAVSGIASIRNLTTALTSPIAGTLSDKYGARRLILVGIVLCGLGYLLASRATSLWQLYLFLGVLVGICNGITFSPIIATVTRWFGSKSALANGVASSGISISQIVLPPVVTFLIAWRSWETAFIILGGAAWVLGTLSWSFIKNPPAAARQPQKPEAARGKPEVSPLFVKDYTLAEAMRTPTFWFLFFIYVFNAVNFQMVVVHIVIDAVGAGAAAGAAALILTIIGITNTVGRLGISGLADRIGGRTVLALCMILQAGILYVLGRAGDLQTFYIAGAVYGILYGSVQPIVPALSGDYFGTRNMGAIFGMLNAAYMGGAAIGPLLAGYVFDITGSYYTAFVITAILAAIAFVLCLLLRRPERKAASV